MAFINSVLYTLAALFAYSIIKRLVNAHILSPLPSSIPGPWHTRYTSLASQYHRLRGTKTHWVHRLHATYPDSHLVRIQPDQVSSCSPTHWEHMHRMGGGFTKTAFHERFRVGPEHMLFSIVDVKRHAARRRLFARALTGDAVRRNWEGVVRERVVVCVERIRRELETDEGAGTDVLKWWRLMTADVIAQLSFGGESFRMLESGGESEGVYFRALENAGVNLLLRDTFPGWLLELMATVLPGTWLKDVMAANQIVTEKGAVAVKNMRAKKAQSQNLFSNMIAEAEKAGETEGKSAVDDLTDNAIISEAAGFLLAGSDTTSMAITFALWAILKRPQLRERLEEEVSQLKPDFTDKDAEEQLPLLNSVIEESLRLYNPGGGALLRRVPPEGVTWDGALIPGGTEVFVQAFDLVRDPNVFPDPEKFDETRFQHLTETQRRLAKPFGIGSRSCIGVPLAKMELRYALALFLRECRGAKLSKAMTDDMMEMRTKFFMYPKGYRLDITLED